VLDAVVVDEIEFVVVEDKVNIVDSETAIFEMFLQIMNLVKEIEL
jgi:hypothetical protein